MPQLMQCPECDKQLQVPEDLLGKDVQCPVCRRAFVAAAPVFESKPDPKPPPRRRPTRFDERTDDDDEYELPIRRRHMPKPSKVQAIAVMSLIGGIFAILLSISLGVLSSGGCCLWPGTYYSLVLGILAIVRSSNLLGRNAPMEKPPTGLAIMHMVNIINGDVTNLVLGIIILVFCNDDEVREYLAK